MRLDKLGRSAATLRGADAAAVVGAAGSLQMRTTKLVSAMRRIGAGQSIGQLVLGDSTGNEVFSEWVYKYAQRLAARYPSHTVHYRLWDDVTQEYLPTEYLQIGAAGRAHVLTGGASTSLRVTTPDAAKFAVTDIRLEFDLYWNGQLPSADSAVISQFSSSDGQRAYRFELTAAGLLRFESTPTGLQANAIARTSPASITTIPQGQWLTLVAQMDVDNGASGNTCTFSYSLDGGSTLVALGAARTVAGTTSIFNSTDPIQFIGRGGGSIPKASGNLMFGGARIYGNLNRTNKLLDIDPAVIPQLSNASSATFTDDAGNPCTVVYQEGRVFGSPRIAIFNSSVSEKNVDYASDGTRWPKLSCSDIHAVFVNYSHNAASDVDYSPEYKTLTDLIVAKYPSAPVICTLQNPRAAPATNVGEHALRLQQVADLAAAQGFDIVDVFSPMSANTALYVGADGIHPTTLGSDLWAALTFAKALGEQYSAA